MTSRKTIAIRQAVAVGFALFAAAFVVGHCVGCTPAQVGAGIDVAGHTAALAECRAEGKDAGSYAVYGRCADEADRKYGLLDGGAP